VILATGASAFMPPIAGIEQSHVLLAADLLKGQGSVGRLVAVVGSGAVGAEVAHMLAAKGHELILLGVRPFWGHGMPPDARWHIERDFARLPIAVETNTFVTAIEGNTIHAERDGEPLQFPGIDTVVIAAGARPDDSLAAELRERGVPVIVVGDALQPRSALEAIAEGYRAACAI
jgi:pyruvate/2-oxoglutarate dehydrogenase complex dihydrolipoamide dehydrogenase (E3) component